jgi:hypothetical protein
MAIADVGGSERTWRRSPPTRECAVICAAAPTAKTVYFSQENSAAGILVAATVSLLIVFNQHADCVGCMPPESSRRRDGREAWSRSVARCL